MAIAIQIIGAVFIIAAVVVFLTSNKKSGTGASIWQIILAVWQIILCGFFFFLCLSDFLDINVNYSYVRLIMDIFYIAAFLAISIFAFVNKKKEGLKYIKGVVWAYIALIAVQCFIFPYGKENEILRILEAVEGIVVFGLLIIFLFKLENAALGRKIILSATILELIVAVENVLVPFAEIMEDFQLIDIPLNYTSLFMRPVLFASFALVYRAWLDRRKA